MNKFIKYNEKLNVIGDNVRKYRENNKWSLTDLSNKLMLLRHRYSKIFFTKYRNGKKSC